MASSETRPNYARRFMMLAVLILLAIAAYSAGWFYLAGELDRRADAAIASLERGGAEVVCAEQSVRGYPFRIGLHCGRTGFSDQEQGLAFSAGAFRSAAQIYDPWRVIAELDGPARLQADGVPPLGLTWEILRASARLASPLPERVSIESRDLAVTADPEAAGGTPLFRIETIQAHMRPNGEDLDLALSFDGFLIDPALVQGREVPALSGESDIAVDDGVALAAAGETSLRSRSGTIRTARLSAGDAVISLAGPFSVDGQGLIDAQLELSVENPQELSALLGQALPELADQVEAFFSGLAAMGDRPTLPLTIADGRVSIAFLDLGQIPPLP